MSERGTRIPAGILCALLCAMLVACTHARTTFFDSDVAAEHIFVRGRRVYAAGGELPLDDGEYQVTCTGPWSVCKHTWLQPPFVRCTRGDGDGVDWDCHAQAFWVDTKTTIVCPAAQSEIAECYVEVSMHNFGMFMLSGAVLLLIVIVGAMTMYAVACAVDPGTRMGYTRLVQRDP